MNNPTLGFDYAPFAPFTDISHEWCTDMRHIQLLYVLGCLFGPMNTIVEIGSFKGASTAAFVALLRDKHATYLACVEPNPQDGLKSVLAPVSCRSSIIPCLGAFKGSSPDFVFIDGDHGKPALKDIEWALDELPKVICLHDTNSVSVGYASCWGAEIAASQLSSHDSYWTIEDMKHRKDERTQRGFMVGIHVNAYTEEKEMLLRELFASDERWWEPAQTHPK